MARHTMKAAEVAATLPLIRSGSKGRDWEFRGEDESLKFYTVRPEDNVWAWNYDLFMGDACFDASKAPKLTISRRKTISMGKFEGQEVAIHDTNKKLVTKMTWLNKERFSTYMYVPSSARKFEFNVEGRQYIWKTKKTLTGLDHICRDVATGRMVARFSNTILPAKLEGKLRISKEVPTTLVLVLLATCLAYRAWNIEIDTIPAGSATTHILQLD